MRKVRVYWNLHKNVYSIQDAKTNKVIDHKDFVRLADVKFTVRKGGQERVRDEMRKNVHAFMVGYLVEQHDYVHFVKAEKVTYNPYKHDTFVTVADETPVLTAPLVTAGIDEGKPSVWSIVAKSDVGLINQQ